MFSIPNVDLAYSVAATTPRAGVEVAAGAFRGQR